MPGVLAHRFARLTGSIALATLFLACAGNARTEPGPNPTGGPSLTPPSATRETPAPRATPTPLTVGVPLTPPATAIVPSCLEGSHVSAITGEPVSVEEARIVPPSGVPPPPGFSPQQAAPAQGLEDELRRILGADAGNFAIIARDLNGGPAVSINPDSVFYAASIFKLFVMFEVFHQVDLGLLDLSTELVISPYYDTFGLSLRATEVCQRLSLAEALKAMLSVSDNAAAVLLQDLVGAGNINTSLAALGLEASSLQSNDLPLTAADAALLLEAIASGSVASASSSEAMLGLLQLEQIDNGLRSGVPPEVEVAHKSGTWPGARHDAGIVLLPSSPYVAVILSADGDTATVSRLSQAIYEFFAADGAGAARP